MALVSVASGCPPTPPPAPINANVTYPAPEPKSKEHFWSSSPSAALIELGPQTGVRNRIVAGFEDTAGLYDDSRFFLVVKTPTATMDGVAISDDFGETWTRPTPFLNPASGRPAEILVGGPSLSSNQERVLYASLAADRTDPIGASGPPTATRVVVAGSDDGVTWSEPVVVLDHGSLHQFVDECSLSYVGNTAVATDVSLDRGGSPQGVLISTSDDDGTTWLSPPTSLALESKSVARAIVKLTNPNTGYLAYTTFADGTTSRVFVASIHRDPTLGWAVRPLFSTTYQVNVTVPIKPAGPGGPEIQLVR